MPSMSTITLIGNAGSDAKMTYLPGGQAVTNFSVAVNERRRQADGALHEAAQWYRVSCWGKLAEVAGEFVTKGPSVYVEGPVQVREYAGADGQKRVSLEVTARALQLLGSRDGDAEGVADSGPMISSQQEQRARAVQGGEAGRWGTTREGEGARRRG